MRLSLFAIGIAAASIGSNALAGDFSISPFALYEHAGKALIIDGVSSNYTLGVVGIGGNAQVNPDLILGGKFGYGYSKSQEISFSGAKFNGSVEGTYGQLSANQTILERENVKVFANLIYTTRKVRANDLIGTRNGLALTGKTSTSMVSSDLMVGVAFNITKKITLTGSFGYSEWHLKSTGRANFSSGGINATATKQIDTVGHDPIFAFSLQTTKPNLKLGVLLSHRSLRSKTATGITVLEVEFAIQF